jgi:hypothetical protein
MANLERRVSVLEGPAEKGPFAHLSDAELDKQIREMCAVLGTTLEAEVEEHGSLNAFLVVLKRELMLERIAANPKSRITVQHTARPPHEKETHHAES